jgi:hypothetical protein
LSSCILHDGLRTSLPHVDLHPFNCIFCRHRNLLNVFESLHSFIGIPLVYSYTIRHTPCARLSGGPHACHVAQQSLDPAYRGQASYWHFQFFKPELRIIAMLKLCSTGPNQVCFDLSVTRATPATHSLLYVMSKLGLYLTTSMLLTPQRYLAIIRIYESLPPTFVIKYVVTLCTYISHAQRLPHSAFPNIQNLAWLLMCKPFPNTHDQDCSLFYCRSAGLTHFCCSIYS